MRLPTAPLVSVRLMLLALVAACIGPLVLLAIAVAFYEGNFVPVALSIAAVIVLTSVLGWRLATYISNVLEELSAAVRAAGDAPLVLPAPRFLEELHLGQSFIYATTALGDAHDALRQEEARLRAVLGTARDAIVTADEEGRVILFNRAAEQMFGLGWHEVVGSLLERLLPPGDRATHLESMRRMPAEESKPRYMGEARVVWALRSDGTVFPVTASISCAFEGDRRYYTAIMRPVPEARAVARAGRGCGTLITPGSLRSRCGTHRPPPGSRSRRSHAERSPAALPASRHC